MSVPKSLEDIIKSKQTGRILPMKLGNVEAIKRYITNRYKGKEREEMLALLERAHHEEMDNERIAKDDYKCEEHNKGPWAKNGRRI